MTDFSSLSAARISHIKQSESIAEASQMGLIDRIIDFFKGGVKREAITAIFERISRINLGNGNPANDDEDGIASMTMGLNETERMNELRSLRDLALPEQRHQFQFDLQQNPNGSYSTSITIAGVEVYKNPDIYEGVGAGRLPNLRAKKLQMEFEDAIQTRDTFRLTKTLVDTQKLIVEQMPKCDAEGELLSVEARAEFAFNKLSDILSSMSLEAKTQILSAGTSDFGDRLRGILEFGNDVLQTAVSEKTPIPLPNEASSAESMFLLDVGKHGELLTKPASVQAQFVAVLTVCARDLENQPSHSPISGSEPVHIRIANEDLSTLLPHRPATTINVHTELTDVERRALNLIGISESLLRLQ